MIEELKWLIFKDFKLDWRNRYPVSGVLLYVFALVITTYLSFAQNASPEIWNGLLWLNILFISINAIAKSFFQEENRNLYYFFLTIPERIIAAKLIYYSIYQILLVGITLLIFIVFLGYPGVDYVMFLLNLLAGCLGLSAAFTMISSISSKTSNQSTLMAVLGFPVIIPIIILAVSNSQVLLLGGSIEDIWRNLLALFSVDIIIIALSFILFPFVWKS